MLKLGHLRLSDEIFRFGQTVCAPKRFQMRLLLPLIVTAALGQSATAQGPASNEALLLRGFGTLSATRNDDAGTGYLRYPQNISRASDNNWSVASDSLLGLQVDVNPDQNLSATAQVITRYRAKDRPQAFFEWGFIKHKPNDQWTIQVGRLLTPVQMDAENRFVGYANTTVRADLSAYSLYPLSNHDGVNVTYEHLLGDTTWRCWATPGAPASNCQAIGMGVPSFGFGLTWSKAFA